jgi:hypothetical protein
MAGLESFGDGADVESALPDRSIEKSLNGLDHSGASFDMC